MTNGSNKRGERAALYAAIGVGIGTALGAAFVNALGILSIALFAIFGAVCGMIVGYLYKGSGGSNR